MLLVLIKKFSTLSTFDFQHMLKTFSNLCSILPSFQQFFPQSFNTFNSVKDFTKVFNSFPQSFNSPLLKTFDRISLQNIVFHSFNTPYYYYYIYLRFFSFFFRNKKNFFSVKKNQIKIIRTNSFLQQNHLTNCQFFQGGLFMKFICNTFQIKFLHY